MSSNVLEAIGVDSFSATYFTKYLTKVFGIDGFTEYIDIWSPLYVHHPKASSDKSPVPIKRPPSLLATSIRI